MTPADQLLRRLPYRRPPPRARARLFCLPYAGGTAAAFRPWVGRLGPEVDVCPVQYPGRERLIAEPFPADLPALAALAADAIAPLLDAPFALFGHSLGALVAFELAHLLGARGAPPTHVFVAACAPPDAPRAGRGFNALDDDALAARACRVHGLPRSLFDDPQQRSILLPRLRADFALFDRYAAAGRAPLSAPLTAFAGARDPLVSDAEAGGWAAWTTAPFRLHALDGGHFLLAECRDALLDAVAGELGLAPPNAPPTPPTP